MKKFLFLLLLFIFGMSQSQTKETLMNEIIKHNVVESNCIGVGCSPSVQYARFQKLKRLLSKDELLSLSNHKNPVIRSYTLEELVKSNLGDLPKLLTAELQKNEEAETFRGCIMSNNPTASILYHKYWNKIRFEAMQSARDSNGNNYEEELAAKKRLQTDVTMEQLDSVVIHSKKNVYWLLYHRAFENRVFKASHLPRIEELAFQEHNFYAFQYLHKKHEIEYRDRLQKYLTKEFPTVDFEGEDKQIYFYSFIKYLIETQNKEYKDLVIQVMKSAPKESKTPYYIKKLMERYGVAIEDSED